MLDELGIELNAGSGVFILLGRLDELPKPGTVSSQGLEYLMAVRLILMEVLERFSNKAVIDHDNTSFVCLIQGFEEIAFIKGAAETIQGICKKSLDATLSIALSSDSVEWGALSGKFMQ